mgnify:CR=1 FL=1
MEQHIDCIIAELIALKEEIIDMQTLSKVSDIEPPEELCKTKSNDNSVDSTCDVKPIRRHTNRSFPLNRSKYLYEEQRDQVLQFASDNKDEIIKQSRSNRIPFLQNLVNEKLNKNLSLYMTGKVIQIIQNM